MTEDENKAVRSLTDIAQSIYDQIDSGRIPKMTLPLRTRATYGSIPSTGCSSTARPPALVPLRK